MNGEMIMKKENAKICCKIASYPGNQTRRT